MCARALGEDDHVLALLEHLGHLQDRILEVGTLHQDDIVMAGYSLAHGRAEVVLFRIEVALPHSVPREAGQHQEAIQVTLVIGCQDEGSLGRDVLCAGDGKAVVGLEE